MPGLTIRTLLPVVLLSLVAPAARASTFSVSTSGYLVDAGDAPITDPALTMTFRITDALSGGGVTWAATCPVAVRGGYYAVQLGAGCGAALDSVVLPADAPRWLEVAVGAVTFVPRQPLGIAPTAAVAQRALEADKLGGKVATDFAEAAHAHLAADVTNFDAAAVSAVAAAGSYAAVNHSHATASASTTGFLSAADWSTFNAKVSVEADPKVGTLTPGRWCTTDGAKIDCTALDPASGSTAQATSGTSTPTCDAGTQGTFWYDTSTGTLKICNGASYTALSTVTPPPGAPAAPTVGLGNGQLFVSWSTVSGAASYEVGYQAGSVVNGSATVVAVPSGLTKTISGLTNGTTYAFAVRSVLNAWRSPWSAVTTAAPVARSVVSSSGVYLYSDGTFEPTCLAYLTSSFYGGQGSGYYRLALTGGAQTTTWCDMATDTGGWTLVYQDSTTNSPNPGANPMARNATTIGTWLSEAYKIDSQHVAHTKVLFKGTPDTFPSGFVTAYAIVNGTLDAITGTSGSACGPGQFENNGCEMSARTLDYYSYTGGAFSAGGYWFGDTGPGSSIYTEYAGYRYIWHTASRSAANAGSTPARVVRQVLVR